MKLELTAIYEPQPDGWIVASIAELPGVITQGQSMEEARAMLANALEQMWLARRDLSLAEVQPDHRTERLDVELAGLP